MASSRRMDVSDDIVYNVDDDDDDDSDASSTASGGDAPAFAWEVLDRTWDAVQETTDGGLNLASLNAQKHRDKRQRLQKEFYQKASVQRGLLRFLYVIVDLSDTTTATDYKPSRSALMRKLLLAFVGEFFDQNPISQMGLVFTRNGRAEKVCNLSGSAHHVAARITSAWFTGGRPSVQNALLVARSSLRNIPSYGSREVIMLWSSLSTADPGDIFQTLTKLRADHIRCSMVGMGAEVRVFRHITSETGGTYGVALDEEHMKELVDTHAPPPPTNATKKGASMIQMGFPMQRQEEVPSLCGCHKHLKMGGFFCPRCAAKYCELPVDCAVCGLTLVSSPHLARSYHHLFPVAPFVERESVEEATCFSCMAPLGVDGAPSYECPRCTRVFCIHCDDYVHDQLHNCPGCLSKPTPPMQPQ